MFVFLKDSEGLKNYILRAPDDIRYILIAGSMFPYGGIDTQMNKQMRDRMVDERNERVGLRE